MSSVTGARKDNPCPPFPRAPLHVGETWPAWPEGFSLEEVSLYHVCTASNTSLQVPVIAPSCEDLVNDVIIC